MTADRTLRAATEGDLAAIAEVHLAAYSRSHFTSRLGRRTLVEYYRLFLAGGSEILVLTQPDPRGEQQEKLLGFAVFGRGIAEKIARFKKNHAPDILKTSAKNPVAAAGKVARRLWNRAMHGPAMQPAGYLLLSIAVATRGTGAGGRLLDAFLARAAASGAECAGLYVNADNLAAINAYVARGFVFRELYGGQFYMDRAV